MQTKFRVVGYKPFERISILPFDPWNHNKSLMWLTQDSSTVLTDKQGQINNLAMENSNTNAGDLLKRVVKGMKTNGERRSGEMHERKGE